MVLSFDTERGRVSLSTKKLEPTPGDMLRNPQLVFEKVGGLHHSCFPTCVHSPCLFLAAEEALGALSSFVECSLFVLLPSGFFPLDLSRGTFFVFKLWYTLYAAACCVPALILAVCNSLVVCQGVCEVWCTQLIELGSI